MWSIIREYRAVLDWSYSQWFTEILLCAWSVFGSVILNLWCVGVCVYGTAGRTVKSIWSDRTVLKEKPFTRLENLIFISINFNLEEGEGEGDTQQAEQGNSILNFFTTRYYKTVNTESTTIHKRPPVNSESTIFIYFANHDEYNFCACCFVWPMFDLSSPSPEQC
jgi:hypothetical protein